MKCVTNTLLLCACIAVTSHAQIGIHINANGDVGIGDNTPYARLTLSGPVGFQNGSHPLLYMYENGTQHGARQILSYSPEYPDLGILFDETGSTFRFGDGANAVWMNVATPAIGIGYANPYNTLVIAGSSESQPAILRIGNQGGFDQVNSGAIIFDEDLDAALSDANFCGIAMRYNGLDNRLEFTGDCSEGTDLDNAPLIMAMSRNGNVSIGAQPDSQYLFQVAGGMRAREIIVESNWADYVFSPDYRLMPLPEVYQFILQNGHLPNIPSAADVSKDGLPLADMSARMMEKIEELTLYTIDQDRTIAAQQRAIEQLITETQQLREEIATLKN